MHIKKGDLIQLALNGEFDVIVHGCNCHCQMGRGIALTIKKLLPEAYVADCQTPKSDKSKLGTISIAEIKRHQISFVVVNGFVAQIRFELEQSHHISLIKRHAELMAYPTE